MWFWLVLKPCQWVCSFLRDCEKGENDFPFYTIPTDTPFNSPYWQQKSFDHEINFFPLWPSIAPFIHKCSLYSNVKICETLMLPWKKRLWTPHPRNPKITRWITLKNIVRKQPTITCEWPSRRDTKLETTRDLVLPTVSGGAGNQIPMGGPER